MGTPATERVKKYQNRLIAEGRCVDCRNLVEVSGTRRCDGCQEIRNERRRDAKAARLSLGMCHHCGKHQRLKKARLCLGCKLREMAGHLWGDASQGDKLLQLLESQDFQCPYTGEHLEIGFNCELDHIHPKAKGGLNELSNLQWVLKEVNRFKRDTDEARMLEIVKRIYEHRSKQVA